MELRLALLICVLFSTPYVTVNERIASSTWTPSGDEIATQTSQTSNSRNGSLPESWDAVTPDAQQLGREHTTSKSTIQGDTTPQLTTFSEEATKQETFASTSEGTADNVFFSTSITPKNENNTDFVQTTVPIIPGDSVWLVALDRSQLVLSVVGFLANTVTFITLTRNGDMFQYAICLLLKHQAVLDSLVCAMGTALLLETPMWTTGNDIVDVVVCHVWHGQALFWGTILLSVWTLASIAIERYVAVCHPFHHAQAQGQLAYRCIAAMHVANLVLMCPSFLDVHFENGVCLSEYLIQGETGEKMFYAYSLVWFFAVYLLPVTAYVYLYGSVIIALYRRSKSADSSRSKVTDSAQAIVTKTAITLTVIFMFAIGFDAWAYVLGYTGVVEYEFGSAKQKVGVFFSVFNSIINPFVYLALMSPFRVSLRKTFSCCLKDNVLTGSHIEVSETSFEVSSSKI